MMIRTTSGLKPVAVMKSARLLLAHSTTAASGSVAVPGFDAAKGFVYQIGGGGIGMGLLAFRGEWRAAEGRFYWSAHAAGQPLTLYFFATG